MNATSAPTRTGRIRCGLGGIKSSEQVAILKLLIERVDYDGAVGSVEIAFHQNGMKMLAAEVTTHGGDGGMTKGMTVKRQFDVRRGRSNRRQDRPAAKPKIAAGCVPRISRLMALAIRFDELVQDGVVENLAKLARLGHVTRARLTQISNLRNLRTDIQEDLLYLFFANGRRDRISERTLRCITAELDWQKRRQARRVVRETNR